MSVSGENRPCGLIWRFRGVMASGPSNPVHWSLITRWWWNVCGKGGSDIQRISETRNPLGNKVLTHIKSFCVAAVVRLWSGDREVDVEIRGREVSSDTNPTTQWLLRKKQTTLVKRNFWLSDPITRDTCVWMLYEEQKFSPYSYGDWKVQGKGQHFWVLTLRKREVALSHCPFTPTAFL
jgi:hypothetical protein